MATYTKHQREISFRSIAVDNSVIPHCFSIFIQDSFFINSLYYFNLIDAISLKYTEDGYALFCMAYTINSFYVYSIRYELWSINQIEVFNLKIS